MTKHTVNDDVKALKKKVDKIARENPPVKLKYITSLNVPFTNLSTSTGYQVSLCDDAQSSSLGASGAVQKYSIIEKSIHILGMIYGSGKKASNLSRMLVLRDKQPKATALYPYSSVATTYDNLIFQGADRTYGTLTNGGFATLPFVYTDPRRFDVLFDETYTTYSTAYDSINADYATKPVKIDRWIKLHDKKTTLMANAVSGLHENDSQIFVFFMTDGADNTGFVGTITFNYLTN